MKPYRDYADFLGGLFDGKVQKISVNAGFSCPNRDGTIGRGGCTYCNNASFSPVYCSPSLSVTEQLEAGKRFFGRKYRDMRYLAYFQSYTGTAADEARLLALYREALAVDGVEGLVIGTRPDCVTPELLESIASLAGGVRGRVIMEYGAESSHDATLAAVNRLHTWADTVAAVEATAAAGIPVGLHLIMGLPGESRADMLATVDAVNALPVDVVKFHQLQLLRGTVLAARVAAGLESVHIFDVDEYVDLCCDIIARLRPEIAIDRFVSQAPSELLIAPRWGLKNYQFVNLLTRRLAQRATSGS